MAAANNLDWFVLGNYRNAATFTARHWHQEIQTRVWLFDVLFDPGVTASSSESEDGHKEMALDFFSKIKEFGLVSNFPASRERHSIPYFEALDAHGIVRSKFKSVTPLSIWTAFALVEETEGYKEIMRERELFHQLDIRDVEEMHERAQIYAKHSRPLTELAEWGQISERYISVDLRASEDQLLKEFKLWLVEERGKLAYAAPENLPTKMFTEADYQDWYLAKILPYFDLRAIAKIEGVHAPNHLIANLLFPEEVGVDVSERVRKVTQIKAKRVFTHEVASALYLQAEMESRTGTE